MIKNIKLLNKIAKVGTDRLDPALFNVGEDVEAPYGIMVRSANMLDMEFNPELRAIARAGAGVNNIPIDRCTENGVVVFNTPGANANAVKELVICGLMLASRDVVGGIKWASELTENVAKAVEKGKGQFAGVEVAGKTLGVVGLGAIGGMVANTAVHLRMNVVGCDPYLSVEAAWNLDHHVNKAGTYDDIYACSDYITLHVPSTPQTKGMINKETIAKMKDGVRILNFARADLVNAADLKEALEAGADIIMLDNMSIEDMRTAVELCKGKAETECSGNVTRENVARLVDIGVDYISSGALTHSAPILDLSLKNLHAI